MRAWMSAGRHNEARFARTAVAVTLVLAGTLAGEPARAQFVCDPGGGATATGTNSVACGTSATANGDNNTALGALSQATGIQSTAVGENSRASSLGSVAVGHNTLSTNTGTIAIGDTASATGISATAIGEAALANQTGATATGSGSRATANNATAYGYQAFASGVSATALGYNTSAAFANSTAIGSGAATTRTNQVSVGTSTNTYTFAGIASAASTAAQSGAISVVTTDANGNLAAVDPASLGIGSAELSSINSRLDQHDREISKNTEGVAIALAMAGVPTLTSTEKFAMSANWGIFEGQNGFAGGAAMRLDRYVQLNGGVGFGNETVGGRAGMRIGW